MPLAIATALFVLILFVAVSFPDPLTSGRCPDAALREGTATEHGLSLFPPGMECTVMLPNGDERSEVYVPWLELLFATAVAGITWVVMRRVSRPPRVVAEETPQT